MFLLIISSGAPNHNKHNMYVFPMYFNVIISYSFTTATPPPPTLPCLQKKCGLQTCCHLPFWIYYPICFSLQHITVHALSLLILWYWSNMYIQLISFKYDACHKEFKPKSAAASWNATLSCLLSSHLQDLMLNCACELHHFMNFWRYHSLCTQDPCIHYWN